MSINLELNKKQDKVGIFYHADCSDGFASAFIAWQYVTIELELANVELVSCKYGDPDIVEAINSYDLVYMVDFCLPNQQLFEVSTNMFIMDHHKTAMEEYWALVQGELVSHTSMPEEWQCSLGTATIFFNINECGASLTYKLLYGEGEEYLPSWVRYIRDRDLWRKELPHTDEVAMYMSMVPHTLEDWTAAVVAHTDMFGELVASGKLLLSYKQKLIKEIAATAKQFNLDGHWGQQVYAPGSLASDVGNYLCEQGATFAAINTGSTMSLRSQGDFDVSVIAKAFGGGGHKNAAGYTLPNEEKVSHHE